MLFKKLYLCSDLEVYMCVVHQHSLTEHVAASVCVCVFWCYVFTWSLILSVCTLVYTMAPDDWIRVSFVLCL